MLSAKMRIAAVALVSLIVVAILLSSNGKRSTLPVVVGVASDPKWFGFNENWREMAKRVGLSVSLGANTNRIPVYWSTIEPAPERFDWKATGYDQAYRAMVRSGQRPLLAVQSAPAWASG